MSSSPLSMHMACCGCVDVVSYGGLKSQAEAAATLRRRILNVARVGTEMTFRIIGREDETGDDDDDQKTKLYYIWKDGRRGKDEAPKIDAPGRPQQTYFFPLYLLISLFRMISISFFHIKEVLFFYLENSSFSINVFSVGVWWSVFLNAVHVGRAHQRHV